MLKIIKIDSFHCELQDLKKDSQTQHKSSKTVEHVTGLANPFLFFFFSTATHIAAAATRGRIRGTFVKQPFVAH